MDRRGGCCIARYANGSVYDMSKVDRIMLKFRPIAPKPVTGVAGSGGSPTVSNERVSPKKGRGKRKYNKENKSSNKKVNSNSTSNKKRKASSEETELTRKTSCDSVVTLSLLPETPERKESIEKENSRSPVWLSFGSKDKFAPLDCGHVERTAVMTPQPVAVTSTVTVERVTDTWLNGNMLGCSDEERLTNLMKDTCPGFISDGLNQVGWTNKAYGEMVGSEEVIVWLVMKESVPFTCDAFSCRVRVQSTCRKEKGTLTLPCDVWRMDGGGFAWRLDVEAALSLGR